LKKNQEKIFFQKNSLSPIFSQTEQKTESFNIFVIFHDFCEKKKFSSFFLQKFFSLFFSTIEAKIRNFLFDSKFDRKNPPDQNCTKSFVSL